MGNGLKDLSLQKKVRLLTKFFVQRMKVAATIHTYEIFNITKHLGLTVRVTKTPPKGNIQARDRTFRISTTYTFRTKSGRVVAKLAQGERNRGRNTMALVVEPVGSRLYTAYVSSYNDIITMPLGLSGPGTVTISVHNFTIQYMIYDTDRDSMRHRDLYPAYIQVQTKTENEQISVTRTTSYHNKGSKVLEGPEREHYERLPRELKAFEWDMQ